MQPTGIFYSTWFLFYRQDFPVLAKHQNTLFVNEDEIIQAVYYDYGYLISELAAAGLRAVSFTPPQVKGFQWVVLMKAC